MGEGGWPPNAARYPEIVKRLAMAFPTLSLRPFPALGIGRRHAPRCPSQRSALTLGIGRRHAPRCPPKIRRIRTRAVDGAFRPHRGFGAMQRAVDAMLSVGTDDGRPSLLQAMAHPLWPNGPRHLAGLWCVRRGRCVVHVALAGV